MRHILLSFSIAIGQALTNKQKKINITFICPSVRTAGCPWGRWTEGAATVTGVPDWMGTDCGVAWGWPCACTCG